MARITSSSMTTNAFVADANSVDQINGATIDWANVASYDGTDGYALIPAGTIMAQTSAGWLPRVDSGIDTATGILVSPAYENDLSPDALSGYGIYVGGVFYLNLMPDGGHASIATWQGELEAAGVGTGWSWQTFGDSRVS